jgi:hypothetical protein
MTFETWSRCGLAAVCLLLSAKPTSAQPALDQGIALHARTRADTSHDGRTHAEAHVILVPYATIAEVRWWPDPVQASRPRTGRYARIGGVVGFAATALIARSSSCPDGDCIDTGEASFPIVGVVFHGAVGAGAGALIGGGIGAIRDQRDRERRAKAGTP